MSFEYAFVVGLLAFLLAAIIFYPGELEWRRRPWFAKRPPSRPLFAVIVAGFLVVAVVHALR
jgi:uncharacterized membrane protein YhhN